jgi:3-oxoacyl-[acyl-carrier-protein] synthase II
VRIRRGACELGLAGGYDALTRFVHLGFDSLGATTTSLCAPFDKARSGFFIGDGAAILVLESLTSARKRGARIRAEILGYGETADAHHQTQPDPEGRGVARAIRQALESGGVTPAEVGYVNAHGTGTPANDAAEARGLLEAMGEAGRRVPISSTKPLVGHTLGAAGAVEQCFCILALERGFLPVQANLAELDPRCDVNVVRGPESGPAPRVAMNHAFGFGGANGVLLARRWEESA